MDVGLLTECLAEVSLVEVARWAAENGFRALELPCLARGSSWAQGSRLVPSKIDDAAAAEIDELTAATGLQIAALCFEANMLDADRSAREAAWQALAATVAAAARLRVPAVVCRIGRDPALREGENLAEWGREAERVLRVAEEGGVRLAVDVDPCCGGAAGHLADLPGNLAFAPELWEKLFTHARSDAVGLCIDPGVLTWLGVDVLETVTGYLDRLVHVRGRDVELFRDRRSDCSVLRPGGGWFRYRLSGLGEVPWARLVARLQEIGYQRPIIIDHSDPVWQGSQDQVKRGLLFARDHLQRHIV